MCCSAGEWGAPGNSSQVSRRALKWTSFLLPGHWLHQDCPPVAGDALPANHQKWPRDASHHTTSDSNTTPPCHCSQGTKNSQSEALQMPREHVQKAAPLCWPGRNNTDVSSQQPPKERKKNGGYQHPDWPPRIKRSREVCSKLSRDRRKQIHHLICNHLNMTFSNHFLSYFSSNTQKIYTIIGH